MIKVREEGRVRSCSALLATAINEEGYREIVGLQSGAANQNAVGWTSSPGSKTGASPALIWSSPITMAASHGSARPVPRGQLAAEPNASLRQRQ